MSREPPVVAAQYAGPWTLASDLVRSELDAYLADAGDSTMQGRPTRCELWTVHDVTAHLAETFRRYADLLERSRAGEFAPPFAVGALSGENVRRVNEFTGDPIAALREQCARFLAMAADPAEPMAHQYGPIPVGLQVLFGLSELAIHHDDVVVARSRSYRPSDAVITALKPVWDDVLGLTDPDEKDPWRAILIGSGR